MVAPYGRQAELDRAMEIEQARSMALAGHRVAATAVRAPGKDWRFSFRHLQTHRILSARPQAAGKPRTKAQDIKSKLADRPGPLGRLSALSLSHSKSIFVWRFCMGAQGAYQPKTTISGPGSGGRLRRV
jgi:hypothetical protein